MSDGKLQLLTLILFDPQHCCSWQDTPAAQTALTAALNDSLHDLKITIADAK